MNTAETDITADPTRFQVLAPITRIGGGECVWTGRSKAKRLRGTPTI
jgi:hypothetical protein